jgi:hypothetical protein
LILRRYIDESHDAHIFNLTAVIADGGTWFYFEQDWLTIIEDKNASLREQGRKPISRYHTPTASFESNNLRAGTLKRKSIFVNACLLFLRDTTMHIVGYSVNLQDLVEEIPEAAANPERFEYVILLCYVLLEIAC